MVSKKNKATIYLITIIILLSLPILALTGVTLQTDEITSNEDFFTLSISTTPSIDINTWTLSISGLVENSTYITYEEIASYPSNTVTATLKCVEGPSGTAKWTGVQVKYILSLFGIQAGAKEVVFHAADGFSSSLTLEDANEDDVILAYEMNGETLPEEQGFPLRLVAPGKAGYKWVMWIDRIELVDYDYKGYWESRGWDDNAELGTFSEWGLHAYLLAFGFIFGGLATVSGYKITGIGKWFQKLPRYVNRRFHRISSKLYLIFLIFIFIYWVYTTLELRGDVFYSGHGKLSIMVIILTVVGGATGAKGMQKYRYVPDIHRNATLFGFILYIGVMVLGLILAY
jgi:hypothetical protein